MTVFRRLAVRALQTTGLNRTAHRLYYRHLHGFESATPQLAEAMDRCIDLALGDGLLGQGDYCEFGIFKGATLWRVQRRLVPLPEAEGMRFFGFDSFEGLPEVEGVDRTSHDEFYAGQYACSLDRVREQMTVAGTDWDRTILIKGYFSDSLTPEMAAEHGLERIALALVDCDLYHSTVDVLSFIGPRLVDGAIVVMDDWGCFRGDARRGQQRAMSEFLEQHDAVTLKPLFRYGAWGQVFRFHGSIASVVSSFAPDDDAMAIGADD